MNFLIFKFRNFDLKENFVNNWKNANAFIFLNYALKWYEASRSRKNHLVGEFYTEVWTLLKNGVLALFGKDYALGKFPGNTENQVPNTWDVGTSKIVVQSSFALFAKENNSENAENFEIFDEKNVHQRGKMWREMLTPEEKSNYYEIARENHVTEDERVKMVEYAIANKIWLSLAYYDLTNDAVFFSWTYF